MSLGVDNAWSLSEFKRNLGVRITGGPSAAAGAEAEAAAPLSAGTSSRYHVFSTGCTVAAATSAATSTSTMPS